MSRVIAILLMLILPLQALAAAQRQLAHIAGFPPDHMAAHAEHLPHHHDEDGEIEFDDSTESASHELDFDFGTHLQAPLPADVLLPLTQHSHAEPLSFSGGMPDPGRSPPLRPPHTTA